MIIHTSNEAETKFAVALREQIGFSVCVIPEGVQYFFVTLEEKKNGFCEIVVEVMDKDDQLLDKIVGFDSCQQAYDLAKGLAEYCNLGEGCYEGDCWDGV
ncbi:MULTISPECIES: hypothetical protein [Bacillus]|uniref:hypothetical protein n=1 Tax=Bacillus TaxID=1386 RepID=UPI000308CAAA|nr:MULTISPECIES: hypothetical protein [Bacillus]